MLRGHQGVVPLRGLAPPGRLDADVALSLSGGYILGLGVSRGMDQITDQAPASMKGFHVDAGATMLLGDRFAL